MDDTIRNMRARRVQVDEIWQGVYAKTTDRLANLDRLFMPSLRG